MTSTASSMAGPPGGPRRAGTAPPGPYCIDPSRCRRRRSRSSPMPPTRPRPDRPTLLVGRLVRRATATRRIRGRRRARSRRARREALDARHVSACRRRAISSTTTSTARGSRRPSGRGTRPTRSCTGPPHCRDDSRPSRPRGAARATRRRVVGHLDPSVAGARALDEAAARPRSHAPRRRHSCARSGAEDAAPCPPCRI